MMTDEAEYPELHRRIRLVPKDIKLAIDPAVCRYLDKLAEVLQPLVDEAMAELAKDVLVYGTTIRPIEAYVGNVLESKRLREELKAREELMKRLE